MDKILSVIKTAITGIQKPPMEGGSRYRKMDFISERTSYICVDMYNSSFDFIQNHQRGLGVPCCLERNR